MKRNIRHWEKDNQAWIDYLSKTALGQAHHLISRRRPRIVLAYHGVGLEKGYCVNPSQFRKQMSILRQCLQPAALKDVISERSSTSNGLMAAVTFDDAYSNFIDYALPTLFELGIPSTVFSPLNYLGSYNRWDYPGNGPRLSIMSAADLRELSGWGVAIGSHTKSHARLRGLSRQRLNDEIQVSKCELEDILGAPVTSFSYPYGDFDKEAVKVTQLAGYDMAVTAFFGRINGFSNRYLLKRITVLPNDSLEVFSSKLLGRYDWVEPKESMSSLLRRLAFF